MQNVCSKKWYTKYRKSSKVESKRDPKAIDNQSKNEIRKIGENKVYEGKNPGEPQASEDYSSKDFLQSSAEKQP